MASQSHFQREDEGLMFIPKSPHFFKLVLDKSIQAGKLAIPRDFVKKYGNRLMESSSGSVALVGVPSGEVWEVELWESEGRKWFRKGWPEFANYYSLRQGHVLVFRYQDTITTSAYNNFHVSIFDTSASEIEYPFAKAADHKDSDSDSLEEFAPCKKRREKSPTQCLRPPKKLRRLGLQNVKQEDERFIMFTPKPPHFFKTVLDESIEAGKLGIPRDFVKKYGNGLMASSSSSSNSVALVRAPSRAVWEMELWKSEDGIWFRKGWQEFAKYYSLRQGYYLVFRYEGTTTSAYNFHVSILDKGASEIEYPFAEILTADEKARAIGIANAFKSDNPFFLLVIKPAHLDKDEFEMALPVNFASNSLIEKLPLKEAVLILRNWRCWIVEYTLSATNCLKVGFGFGWKKFAGDNNLKAGDICVFVLVKGKAAGNTLHARIHPKQDTGKKARKGNCKAILGLQSDSETNPPADSPSIKSNKWRVPSTSSLRAALARSASTRGLGSATSASGAAPAAAAVDSVQLPEKRKGTSGPVLTDTMLCVSKSVCPEGVPEGCSRSDIVQKGLMGVQALVLADNMIARMERENKELEGENGKLKAELGTLRARYLAETARVKEQIEQLQREKSAWEEERKQVQPFINNVATQFLVRTRYEMIREFKQGMTAEWDLIEARRWYLAADTGDELPPEEEDVALEAAAGVRKFSP